MIRHFKGWIPAVSGNLSFDAIGATNFPTPQITANQHARNKRYIVTYHRRDTSDVPALIRPFQELFFGYQTEFVFACVAETLETRDNGIGLLKGRLFLFPSESYWNAIPRSETQRAQNLLNAYDQAAGLTLEEHFGRAYDRLSDVLTTLCSFSASFRLKRSGTLTLTVNTVEAWSKHSPPVGAESKVLLGERISIAKLVFLKLITCGLYKQGKYTTASIHLMAAQLFFFLRDIAHHHQHHASTTDTIVDLYPVSSFKADQDLEWRLQTLYRMYRKVVNYRRNPSHEVFHSALGIQAYAKSFRKLSERELPKRLHRFFPPYNDDEMESSINSSGKFADRSRDDSQKVVSYLTTIFFGLIGLTLSYASLIKIAVDAGTAPSAHLPTTDIVNPGLFAIASFLLAKPTIAVSGGFVAAIVIAYGYSRRVPQPFRDVLRFLQTLPTGRTVTFIGLASTLLIVGGSYLVARYATGH